MDRIVNVFFDNQCYPFKDKERTVRYPITGSTFSGSSNVNELHFYVRDIGGVNNLSWVAIVKLPNGKILYQLLTDIHLDSEINEYYVSFNLSQFYTQLKGDIYISLNGCLGQVEITTDSETDIATIQGEIDSKTVVATGAVKFSINYAPQRPIGLSFDLDQYQTIIDALANKSNIVNTIQVIADITTEDLSKYDNGQLFYSLSTNTKGYYVKTNTTPYFALAENNGLLGSKYTLVRYYTRPELELYDLIDIIGVDKLFILNATKDYLAKFIYSAGDYQLYLFGLNEGDNGADIFVYYGIVYEGDTVADYLDIATQKSYLQKKSLINTVYGISNTGAQVMIGYSANANPSALVLRDSDGQVNVPQLPIDNEHATSKKYVDDIDTALRTLIDDLVRNAFINVDTTQYPTLESFLASQGQEGFIYLYPVNTSDLTQGYHQYIWEQIGGAYTWQDLGTTQIDLSDYYTKSQVNTLLNGKVDKKTTSGLYAYSHYGSHQSEIAISNDQTPSTIPVRDDSGNIKVSTPIDDRDATPRLYVDTLGGTKVDKTSSSEKLYGTDELGSQTTYGVDSDIVGDGLVVRRNQTTGTVVVGTPTNNTHATTKAYVDTSIANAISNVYKIKGSKTVAQINALTGQQVGDVYNLLDSGTITLGDLQVFTGDNIVWTGSAWDKLGAEIDWSAYDEKFIAAGFFEVQPYNESTGEITFVYSTELYIMDYDSSTGIMTISAN